MMGGLVNFVGIAAAHVIPVPSAPTGVSASNSPAQITVSWSAVSGATSYKVYYNTSNSSSGATLAASGIIGTSYTINGPLTSGTTYYCFVVATNSAGGSGYSSSASAVAAAIAGTFIFVIPSGSSVTITGGGITGTWTGPVTKPATSGTSFTATVLGGGGSGGSEDGSGGGGGASSVSNNTSSTTSLGTIYIAASGGGGGDDLLNELGTPGFGFYPVPNLAGGAGGDGGDGGAGGGATSGATSADTSGNAGNGGGGSFSSGGAGGRAVGTISTQTTYYINVGGGGSGAPDGGNGSVTITVN